MELPEGYIRTTAVDGTELIVYTIDAGGEYPIHGAYYSGEEWIPCVWRLNGHRFGFKRHNLDLTRSYEPELEPELA